MMQWPSGQLARPALQRSVVQDGQRPLILCLNFYFYIFYLSIFVKISKRTNAHFMPSTHSFLTIDTSFCKAGHSTYFHARNQLPMWQTLRDNGQRPFTHIASKNTSLFFNITRKIFHLPYHRKSGEKEGYKSELFFIYARFASPLSGALVLWCAHWAVVSAIPYRHRSVSRPAQ